MRWGAIVPVNYGRDCKTRLAGRLDRDRRTKLVELMARQVISELQKTASIAEILMVSPKRLEVGNAGWAEDLGRGLNAELAAARTRFAQAPVAFVHADLPFLATQDLSALLDAAERSGTAIAPDRHAQGTNALAVADGREFMPMFGRESFSRHGRALPNAAIVRTNGLSFDLDEEEDLDIALARGFVLP